MEKNQILIEHGTVVTLDEERRIIKDGAILVEGSEISYVGKMSGLTKSARGGRVINAEGKLVLPGLINTHTHLEYSGIDRGIADDMPLTVFLSERLRPIEAVTRPEEIYISTMLSCLEMIKTGTTCVCDTGGFSPESVAKAVEDAGIRATVAYGSMDIAPPERPLAGNQQATTEENLGRSESLIKKWHGAAGDRIRARCSIRVLPNVSEELILGLNEIAGKYGVGVNIHASDTAEVVEAAKRMRGCREIEYLDQLGVLGPRWMGVHMVWLSDDEVEIIRKHDMKISHCPGGALHLGFGCTQVGKFVELVQKGVTVTLSQDSTTANNSLDMFRSLYLLSIHKDARIDPTIFPPEKALEMATIDGAKALLWEDKIGSLEPGKKADIILVDTRRSNWVPMHEFSIVPNLVYSGDGADVETVIIDGNMVMENRQVKTMDEHSILQKAQKASEEILERSQVRITPRWKVE
jgi:5-methylthioadenosine/S-adenosylhomocysteine deaminase